MNKPGTSTFLGLWGMPSLLAVLTVFGLLSALLGTGAWHYLSWLALAVPPVVIAWFVFKPQACARH